MRIETKRWIKVGEMRNAGGHYVCDIVRPWKFQKAVWRHETWLKNKLSDKVFNHDPA